jgi:hypothetical protein
MLGNNGVLAGRRILIKKKQRKSRRFDGRNANTSKMTGVTGRGSVDFDPQFWEGGE